MPDPEEAPAEVLRPQSDWELLGHDHSNGDPRVVVKDPATGERVKIPVAEWSSIRDGSTSPESPEATDPPEEVEALGDIATVATTEVNPPPPVASGGEGTPPAGPIRSRST